MGLEAEAREYVKSGFSVFPLGVNSKLPENGFTWKPYQTKYVSDHTLSVWGDSNIGLVCGALSGVVVLDIDDPDHADEIAERYGIDLDGPNVVATGGDTGKRHVYFKHPGHAVITKARFIPGADVRGDGGYVVAPPSVHPVTGNPYRWLGGTRPEVFPDMPENMSADLAEAPSENETTHTGWADVVEKGARNDALARKAGSLIRHGLDKDSVRHILRAWNTANCNPPLPPTDVDTVVESIWRRNAASTKKEEPQDFEIITFAEALERYEDYELDWLVKDWMPKATCALVIAPPGLFKTWMLLDLSVSVARGDAFLGLYPAVGQGPVLVVQQEDPMPMVMERIGYAMDVGGITQEKDGSIVFEVADYMPPIHFHTRRSLDFRNAAVVEGMKRTLVDRKFAMMILDPLYSAGDTDDYMAKTAKEMLVFKDIRDEVGTSFVVAHHTTSGDKGNGRARDKAWGSQFLNAWLETGWQIEEDPDSGVHTVNRNFKMCENPDQAVLDIHIKNGRFWAEPYRHSTDDVDKLVADYIKDNKVDSLGKIADALGIPKSTVARAAKRLEVVKLGGFYKLPNN